MLVIVLVRPLILDLLLSDGQSFLLNRNRIHFINFCHALDIRVSIVNGVSNGRDLSEDPEVELTRRSRRVSARYDDVSPSGEIECLDHLSGIDKVITPSIVRVITEIFLIQLLTLLKIDSKLFFLRN